jgi:tRNA A-37 threonylcarbamoyl transferase component Bud32
LRRDIALSSVPKKFVRYRILEVLGEGAAGRVFLAQDPVLGRRVVLKVLKSQTREDVSVARFLREAQLLARHPHEAILPLLDASFDASPPYMVTPWMSGGTLEQWVEREGAVSREDLLPMAIRLARALGHLHANKVLHRDMKPANVLLDEEGQAFLADLGLSRIELDVGLTGTGFVVGTPIYMAPEIVSSGEYSPQSDLFGLGAVLLEAVRGRRLKGFACELENVQQALKEVGDSELRKILRWCLRSLPEDRPESGEELARCFRELKSTKESVMARVKVEPLPSETFEIPLPRPDYWSEARRRLTSAAGMGGLFLVCFYLAYMLFGRLLSFVPRGDAPPPQVAVSQDADWLPLEVALLPGDRLVRKDGVGGVVRLYREKTGRVSVHATGGPGATWEMFFPAPWGGEIEIVAFLVDESGGYLVLELSAPQGRGRLGILWRSDGKRAFVHSEPVLADPKDELRLVPLALLPQALFVFADGALLRVDRGAETAVQRYALPGIPGMLVRRKGDSMRVLAGRGKEFLLE